MSIVVSLALVVAFAFLCHKPLKSHPIVFYGIALLISVLGIYLTWNPAPYEVVRTLTFAIQKGHLGFSFFVVVMFIGVFDRESMVRRLLSPVRAELSIMGSILIIAHFVPYLKTYLGMVGNLLAMRPTIAFSLVAALILLVLLVVLTVTSFDRVKKAMTTKSWKGVQKLAYVFFVLVFLHLAGYLLVPALSGSVSAMIGCVSYGVVLVAYVVLRSRRTLAEKAARDSQR